MQAVRKPSSQLRRDRRQKAECAGQVPGWLAILPLSFICSHLQITTAGVNTNLPPLKKEQQRWEEPHSDIQLQTQPVLCSTDSTACDSREGLEVSKLGRAVGSVSMDSYVALYKFMRGYSFIQGCRLFRVAALRFLIIRPIPIVLSVSLISSLVHGAELCHWCLKRKGKLCFMSSSRGGILATLDSNKRWKEWDYLLPPAGTCPPTHTCTPPHMTAHTQFYLVCPSFIENKICNIKSNNE